MSSNTSLSLLMEGNARFASGVRSVDSLFSSLRLRQLALTGQNPFAIIVTCSDSRVPTETVFDCGLGDLFVIRVAGNVMSDLLFSGIEYAVNYFSVPLCIVMGHSRCGAVQAAANLIASPGELLPSTHLQGLVHLIGNNHPKNEIMDPKSGEQVRALTISNIRNTAQNIRSGSALIANRIQNSQFRVEGALYDIDSGKVYFDLLPDDVSSLSEKGLSINVPTKIA